MSLFLILCIGMVFGNACELNLKVLQYEELNYMGALTLNLVQAIQNYKLGCFRKNDSELKLAELFIVFDEQSFAEVGKSETGDELFDVRMSLLKRYHTDWCNFIPMRYHRMEKEAEKMRESVNLEIIQIAKNIVRRYKRMKKS
jgi:hypothetical protein